MEFWHCPVSQRSTWGDPGAGAEFVARVIDKLRQALPKASGAPKVSQGASSKQAEVTQEKRKSRRNAEDKENQNGNSRARSDSSRGLRSKERKSSQKLEMPAG